MSLLDPLLALQDVDTQILDVERTIREISRHKAEENEKVRRAQARRASAESELNSRKADAIDISLQVKTNKDKVARIQEQQLGLTGERAVKTLANQLSNTTSAGEELASRQEAVRKDVSEAQDKVDLANAYVDEATAAAKEYIAELNAHLEEAKVAYSDLMKERATLEQSVAPRHLAIYNRLRISRHPTLVKLVNGVCTGCHLKQPPSVEQMVKRDKELVICGTCGRILY